jgi:hypothetical protein
VCPSCGTHCAALSPDLKCDSPVPGGNERLTSWGKLPLLNMVHLMGVVGTGIVERYRIFERFQMRRDDGTR